MSPDRVPHWSNVLWRPSSLFFSFFGVISFVWLLRSDPIAWNFLAHLKMISFVEKLLKLYSAWNLPAPFCTILTQNIKSHKNFLFIDIFHCFKYPKLLWSHLVKSENRMRKALKLTKLCQVIWVNCFVRHPVCKLKSWTWVDASNAIIQVIPWIGHRCHILNKFRILFSIHRCPYI